MLQRKIESGKVEDPYTVAVARRKFRNTVVDHSWLTIPPRFTALFPELGVFQKVRARSALYIRFSASA